MRDLDARAAGLLLASRSWRAAARQVPLGGVPVTLAQADGRGPALDAVYLPPGPARLRSRAQPVRRRHRPTRYLVTDTGVRFAIHDDDDVAHDLGLPTAAIPAPWPVL
ncbi:type VII secretion protein EccB [Mycobacterium tuberculosis]